MSLHPRSIAVIGAGGVAGRLLMDALQEDPAIERIVAIDSRNLTDLPGKAKHASLRMDTDEAVDKLAELIDKADLDTLVYLGYLADLPGLQENQADEVRRIAEALEKRPVPKVIFSSSTTVYGALPGDPTHLDETTHLAKDASSKWVQDKVACESLYQDVMLSTDAIVTVLRFGLPLGPTIENFMTDYLSRKAVPVVDGLDPPVQFVHELDVAGALHHAVKNNCDGIFNIVGEGAMPLSVALRIGRRRSAPVPELGSYPLHHALWEPDIIEAPVVLQDLFRFVWVADGTAAQNDMKFSASRSTKETIEDFYRAHVIAKPSKR